MSRNTLSRRSHLIGRGERHFFRTIRRKIHPVTDGRILGGKFEQDGRDEVNLPIGIRLLEELQGTLNRLEADIAQSWTKLIDRPAHHPSLNAC